MLKNTILFLISVAFLTSISAQTIQLSGCQFTVNPPLIPPSGATYSYLWWFGDGGYKTTDIDATTHLFHSVYSTKSNPQQYRSYLITTEHYGPAGHPDLIYLNTSTSGLTNTTPELPKYLDNTSEYLRVTNYRDAVPNDTFFIIVTYGFPGNVDAYEFTDGVLSLSFDQDNDLFEYVNNSEWNESFFPHNESYAIDSENTWLLPLDGMRPGDERTILLPFVYHGEIDDGSLNIVSNFSYVRRKYQEYVFTNNGGKQSINDSFIERQMIEGQWTSYTENQNGSGQLKFAKSHDPNSTQVSLEQTSCFCGGQELEYVVHFENTGVGATKYIRIVVELDDAHDLSSVELTRRPNFFEDAPLTTGNLMVYDRLKGRHIFKEIDEINKTVTFSFNSLILLGLGDTIVNDPSRVKDFIKFKVHVKDGYVIGKPIRAKASIFFDKNAAVITNEVITTCKNPIQKNNANEIETKHGIPWWIWIIVGVVLIIIIILIFWLRRRKEEDEESTESN